jgi:hypothetical protein
MNVIYDLRFTIYDWVAMGQSAPEIICELNRQSSIVNRKFHGGGWTP